MIVGGSEPVGPDDRVKPTSPTPPTIGPDAVGPLDGFVHDLDVTRFDHRVGRLVPFGLAAIVAWIAVTRGPALALVIAFAIAFALAAAVAVFERDRWRAQDVMHWFQANRTARWHRDTGGVIQLGDPAAAEIWLGAHQPGTVPQLYRAIAASYTGNDVQLSREFAQLPEATADERVTKAWLSESVRWTATGEADVEPIRAEVEFVVDPDLRARLSIWLAQVESFRRWTARDRDWLAPMVAIWPQAPRAALGLRRLVRLWVSRFALVLIFVVAALVLTPTALRVAGRGETIPASYAETTYGTRGKLAAFDEQRFVRVLPALARSINRATRAQERPLGDEAFDRLIEAGLPTVIWTTSSIELAPPADAAGRRVWETEVLLGPGSPTAIVTLDGPAGPRYAYRIDGDVVGALRAAAGVDPTVPSP